MKTIFVFLVAAAAAFAEPRTWTSSDGRTINADYLGRAPDGSALVLLRADTGARVTVPLAALSAEDQAHASTLGTTPAPADPAHAVTATPAKKEPSPTLVALASAWPAPQIPNGTVDAYMRIDHADVIEIQRRYGPDLRAITSGDVAMNCRSLRIKIERDLVRLNSEGKPTGPANSDGQKRAGAARLSAHWLSRQILPHIAKIEAEAAKTETQIASTK